MLRIRSGKACRRLIGSPFHNHPPPLRRALLSSPPSNLAPTTTSPDRDVGPAQTRSYAAGVHTTHRKRNVEKVKAKAKALRMKAEQEHTSPAAILEEVQAILARSSVAPARGSNKQNKGSEPNENQEEDGEPGDGPAISAEQGPTERPPPADRPSPVEAKLPPSRTLSEKLLKKLQSHLAFLEQYVEQEAAKAVKADEGRGGGTAADNSDSAYGQETTQTTTTATAVAAAAATITATQPPLTYSPQPRRPLTETLIQQTFISRQEVERLKSTVATIEVRPAPKAARAWKKSSPSDDDIRDQTLSIARSVLMSQDILLRKGARWGIDSYPAPPLSSLWAPGGALSPSGARPRQKAKPKLVLPVSTIRGNNVDFVPVDVPEERVPPPLSYQLDRVLFNPGVYHLQDPRSKVFNFDPYLAKIMPIEEFDFKALRGWTTSSKDNKLITIAAKNDKKYCGSTSSMTSILSHFHYLISKWRPVGLSHMSRDFSPDSQNFTEVTRAPAAAFLHWRDGVWAIDSDKEYDGATVLSMLGKSMEKLLTLPTGDFEKYRRTRSAELTDEERNADEVYHYSALGDFMMRSQLDAYDRRLPGTGVFDLKTRAVVTVRMNAERFRDRRDYEIRRRFGQFESFEREYFDLIRSAFLKYSLQVRMGRMDGIFVAFHNTQRIFGFQYIPVEEMDAALHGTENRMLGDMEFRLSLKLWNEVLNRFTDRFKGRSIRLHIETRQTEESFMYLFAQPVTNEQIASIQDANTAAVLAFEDQILGISREEEEAAAAAGGAMLMTEEQPQQQQLLDEDEGTSDEGAGDEEPSLPPSYRSLDGQDVWDKIMQRVEETMENEELGIGHVREAIRTALEQSGLIRDLTQDDLAGYVDSLLEALTREEAATTTTTTTGVIKEGGAGMEGEEEVREEEGVEIEAPVEASEQIDKVSGAPEDGAIGLAAESVSSEDHAELANDSGSPEQGNLEHGNPEHGLELADENITPKHTTESLDEFVGVEPVVDPVVFDFDDRAWAPEALSAEMAHEEDAADAAKAASWTEGEGTTLPTIGHGSELMSDSDLAEAHEYEVTEPEVARYQAERMIGEDDGGISAPISLTDLILRSIDVKAQTASAPEMQDERLVDFERILSKLIIGSREQAADGEDGANLESSHPFGAAELLPIEAGGADAGGGKGEAAESSPVGEQVGAMKIPISPELVGLVISIRNKVNGVYKTRPEITHETRHLNWDLEYTVKEIEPGRARTLYSQILTRRYQIFGAKREARGGGAAATENENSSTVRRARFSEHFDRIMDKMSKDGKEYRRREDQTSWAKPVYVWGEDRPRPSPQLASRMLEKKKW